MMRAFVLATALLVVSVTPVFAQLGRTTIGFTVGPALALTEDLNDFTDQDIALQGHATVGLARALAARVEVGQTKFKPGPELEPFCPSCELKLNYWSVGIQYGGFGKEGALGLEKARVAPYGFIALGWYTPSADFDSDERRTGFNAGFGINIRVSDHFGFQADAHVHGVTPGSGSDREYWLTPSGGVYVEF